MKNEVKRIPIKHLDFVVHAWIIRCNLFYFPLNFYSILTIFFWKIFLKFRALCDGHHSFFAYLPETVLRYYYILFDDTMDRSEACFPPSHQLIEELKSARARAPQSTLALFGLLTQCAPKQKLEFSWVPASFWVESLQEFSSEIVNFWGPWRPSARGLHRPLRGLRGHRKTYAPKNNVVVKDASVEPQGDNNKIMAILEATTHLPSMAVFMAPICQIF